MSAAVASRLIGLCAVGAFLFAAVSPAQAQAKRPELEGVWIVDGTRTENLKLTPEGAAARARYDHLHDDPAMRCIPATFKRVMHTPSPPIEVILHDDYAEINYEFMDVRRRVPIKSGLAAKDAPFTVPQFPHLGRSAGRWEGDTLVIESTDLKAGLLDSLGDPGLWQSDQMQTVERFVPNGNRMQVIVTMTDPVNFLEPVTTTFNYLKLPDGKLLTWDCVPEEAGYTRFNEDKPRQPLPQRNGNPQ
jgi:hypothetical protein